MPVNTIIYQPATAQLMAAYRPIVFKVQATSTSGGAIPPYVVCDIYLADKYYKSVLRTAPESFTNLLSVFTFDISDALQEYLQPNIAAIDNNNLLQAPHMSARVYCKFRSSDINEEGFTVEEGIRPVQGTKFTNPVAGNGLLSSIFFAINSALQHEDNQNLASHLSAFKKGVWANNAFPLTHRDTYFFCNGDSDHFPFVYNGDCMAADIILHYKIKGKISYETPVIAQDINVCATIDIDSVEVTGNRVTVTMDSEGGTMLVQYKKGADSTWVDAGTFASGTTFSFNINGTGAEISGDYDIRVINFCTPCLSSDPAESTFTLDGETINLAWRGINPFCVVQSIGQTIYLLTELRNPETEDTFIPNNDAPQEKRTITNKDMYIKFFSDQFFLNPLNLVENNLKIFIWKTIQYTDTNGAITYKKIVESLLSYTVNANGTEAFLENVETDNNYETYISYPTIATHGTANVTYLPWSFDGATFKLGNGNNGDKGFHDLQQYNTDTNIPTGITKPNEEGDTDYQSPTPDEATCPSGPEHLSVTYGSKLLIMKVEFKFGSPVKTLYAYNASGLLGTDAGGYVLLRPVPKNTNVTVTVKAATLDTGNHNGYVFARVTYVDGGGNAQVVEFHIPNNVETTLPQTFQNITSVNITNY